MDESTQEIKEYIDKLPKPLQQAVLGQDWHKRLAEISQKYSLHLDQISSLEYEVLFVMIGMEPETDLVSNIQTELAVSKILAEQLAGDINVRIFQFIMKSLEEKTPEKVERFVESSNEIRDTNKEKENIQIPEQEDLPSFPPVVSVPASVTIPSPQVIAVPQQTIQKEIIPMAMETPHQKITEPPVNLPGEEIVDGIKNDELRITNNGEENRISNLEAGIKNDVIENTVPFVIRNSDIVIPQKSSLADTKLNSIVTSTSETVVKETPAPTPIVKSYASDPYREAIE